ncbi:unnamed protein product, partial [Allacma fusca]
LPSRSSTKKKSKDAPQADNLITLQKKKFLQVQFDYQTICNFCEYEGETASEIARHVGYKCQLPLTNQMLYDLLPEKPKGTFRKTKSRELDASGVSNKALQRMFDQVKLPGNVMIAPAELMYLWIGPRHKGKSRRCSDLRRKGVRGQSRITTFKESVQKRIQEDTLDFVGIPVSFYPTRQWYHLLGMTHSAMIVVKIRDLVNGTVQASFYDSFQPTRSKMFTDRVRQSDVRNIVSRLIGTSVAITEDIVWPSPVSKGCNAVTAFWGLALAMGYPEAADGKLPMPKTDGVIKGLKIRMKNMNKILMTE